jgi:hypothetical protein
MLRRFSVLVISALLAAGCAADVGSGESALEDVAVSDFANETMYIDFSISPRPLTAEEIGDISTATPVQVRFYEPGIAIAWSAPNGQAITESLEFAVAAWNVELTRDDTVTNPGETTVTTPRINPGSLYATTGVVVDDGRPRHVSIDGRARIDWLRTPVRQIEELPPAFHAGCL